MLFLGGCSNNSNPQYSDLDLSSISLSPEMQGPIKAALERLNQLDDPSAAGVQMMAQYNYLSHALQEIDPSAAVDSMLTLWAGEPNNFFWIDLGLRMGNILHTDDRFQTIIQSSALNDTNSAVGCFCRDRMFYPRKSNGQWWQKAHSQQDELTDLQKIWLTKWITLIDRNTSRPEDGVRRILEQLDKARSAGGLRLEFEMWTTITICLLNGDHLDDALHTAALAGIVATKINDPYLLTQTEYWLGRIFAARNELESAKNRYLLGFQIATQHGYNFQRKVCSSRAGGVLSGLGEYPEVLKLDRVNLALLQATSDSLNISNGLMNLASTFRHMGQMDSCLVYQNQAVQCLELYPHPGNEAKMPLLLAKYYAQIGQYARMDSLLNIALDDPTISLVVEEAIKVHVSLIESGLERGRPDLVHRSLSQVDSLRNLGIESDGQIKVDLQADLVIAEFYTRQNDFARAEIHLDAATHSLGHSDSPTARWALLRTQGLLARQRGDLTSALTYFQNGFEIIKNIENPDILANSRFLLGSALLENERFPEALELFPPHSEKELYGGHFRTRLASQLFRGLTLARSGQHQKAAEQFQLVLKICSPWSPMDLVARTQMELGRTMIQLQKPEAAAEHLHLAWNLLLELGRAEDTSLGQVFLNDLRRDTTESLISLYLQWPKTAPTKNPAADTLNLWNHLASNADQSNWNQNAQPKWHPGQAVFFIGNQSSYRWLIGNDGIKISILPSAAELEPMVLPVLGDLSQPGRAIPTQAMVKLSRVLLSESAPYWPADQTLYLVTDGLLDGLPWIALPLPQSYNTDTGTPLLFRGPVVNSLIPVRKLSASPSIAFVNSGSILAIGANSSGQNEWDDLVHAEEEAKSIGELWPKQNATILLGKNATWKALTNLDLRSYNTIHLASHAKVYRGLPEQSYLVFSGAHGQEQLTATTVANLKLNAELVYLSSCEAAAGNNGGISGSFVQAFLTAGAKTVIASNLSVDDQASSDLAMRVYKNWLAGDPLPRALQQGQRDMLEEVPHWSHPFYWAFFRIYQHQPTTETIARVKD